METEPSKLDFSLVQTTQNITQTKHRFFSCSSFPFFSKCPTLHFQAPKTHEQIKSKTNQTHYPLHVFFSSTRTTARNHTSDLISIPWSFRCLGLVIICASVAGFLHRCFFLPLEWRRETRLSIPYRTGRYGRNISYRPAIRYTRHPCFVPEKIPAVPANFGQYWPVQKKVFYFFLFLSFVIFEFLLG